MKFVIVLATLLCLSIVFSTVSSQTNSTATPYKRSRVVQKTLRFCGIFCSKDNDANFIFQTCPKRFAGVCSYCRNVLKCKIKGTPIGI